MITTLDPAPPAVHPRRQAFARDCQILQAVAAGDYWTAANLITNSPVLDWRALVPDHHHAALAAIFQGGSA
jgi:hypothetical protein